MSSVAAEMQRIAREITLVANTLPASAARGALHYLAADLMQHAATVHADERQPSRVRRFELIEGGKQA